MTARLDAAAKRWMEIEGRGTICRAGAAGLVTRSIGEWGDTYNLDGHVYVFFGVIS